MSLVALLALTSTGCIALAVGAAGVGGYAFYKGELKSTESSSIDQVWQATQAAVRDLGLAVADQEKDGLSAAIKAESADGKPITIKLKRTTDKTTELRIRAGHLGGETRARQIHEMIKAKL